MQKSNEQPTHPVRYDEEMEEQENRRECPKCHHHSFVDYIYTPYAEDLYYKGFCLDCGHKE